MDTKNLSFVLCVIAITGIKHYKGDIALKYFNSSVKQYFKKAPKAWQTYIRMFMYRYLYNSQFQNLRLNNVIFNFYTNSITFLNLKDKSLTSRGLLQDKIPYRTNVSRASGKIFISLSSYKYGSPIFQFYFDLNSEIRLNMTFVLLHLRGALLNCSYDKLEVQRLKKSNNRYTYCGFHSNFNFYPDMNVFTVIFTLQLIKPFDLDAIFSVIDKQLIFNPLNYPFNEKKSISLFQLLFYKVANKYYLKSFHVSIVKIYRIQITIAKSKEKNYVIYDGPGYRFNVLNKKEISITLWLQHFSA